MKKKDLIREIEILNKKNIECMNDIKILVSEDCSFLDKQLINLKYQYITDYENFRWNGITVSSSGFYDLIDLLKKTPTNQSEG